MRQQAQWCMIALAAVTLTGCEAAQQAGAKLSTLSFPSLGLGSSDRISTLAQGDCPAISQVAELSSLYQFTDQDQPIAEARVSEAHISKVTSACSTQGDALKLTVNVHFDGTLGPRGRTTPGDRPSFVYPYFIALANAQNEIVSKEILAVSFAYDANNSLQTQLETVPQTITIGANPPRSYKILVGFQLEAAELAYNRTLPDAELGKSLGGIRPAAAKPPVPGRNL